MLIPAWLVKGSACGWRLLRSASPGSSFRATAAAAATAATRLGGGARCGDPRATVAASALSGLAAPSSCARRRELLRVRPPGAEQLLSAPSPTFVCPCRGPGQPRRSRTSHEGAPRPPEDLSQRAPGGAPPRTYAELYENPWTIPNLLSMARIGLAPVLGYLIVEEDFNIALGVFTLAGITDLLDGFIARNWANQKSALGSALDPLADKILISILYISLTYANLIPVPLTALIVLRDIALIAAVFYVRYKTLPPPINTVMQLILVAASLAAPVFNYVDSVYLQSLWCITAFTTTASAYSYYHYGQKTVQVLNNK
ncbi:cardiolipin synthase (CMP-forming) isoform X2 [Varanus komodoensis]|uniref:cardiolipin synthase (CMP-forming) isoform X2 n=1 Tax=Varanus komodoensis TaxID=61221 RepID=UPI001CF7D61A|nr:cardiolipin synthase (CMP-forming) isoform X2 [Varanus komodoensis]